MIDFLTSAKIKVNNNNANYKTLSLTVNNYEQQIETLKKDNGNGEPQFGKEKILLKTAMSDFFQFNRRIIKISCSFNL
ncbi:conserved hypothetical protein (plasmid) [Borreliella garinii Far04]|nr:conserved hypothetical protein [Borreliella garinii Far04]